jgi:hypothetical protein
VADRVADTEAVHKESVDTAPVEEDIAPEATVAGTDRQEEGDIDQPAERDTDPVAEEHHSVAPLEHWEY